MRAIVDRKTCVGCGICADNCAAVFQMDDGVAKVIADDVAIGDADDCREAAESCPVEAITIEE